jgi:siderophore synthetase component
VVLGEAGDDYLPQQSIRTLSNRTSPLRHHLKLPLSVLNTLVWRGLPTDRALAAPRVTAYLRGVRDGDAYLRDECRLVLLGEVASVAVPHRAYESLPGAPYQFRELLGCVWREPPARFLEPGERAMALAGLLRIDRQGTPVVVAMMERAALDAEEWVRRFLGAVLPPLLHYLYRYGTAFSPHGENAMLVHRDGLPVRLALKDFVDDVNLSDQTLPELERVPADVREVLLSEPPAWLCQFLWAGLFIGHFRYLADLLERSAGLPERRFWWLVREEILAYQARLPELAERFELFDLLSPRFAKICLNRNRLLLDGYADRPERPHAAVFGTVRNALDEVTEPAPARA